MLFSTLGLYMARRFFFVILGVFFLITLLIFFADFIEILREGAKRDGIGTMTLAAISLSRVPSFAELALPFAVLIGTIGGYLSFSRTSELIIIRSAGLSVWQFVQPAAFIAAVYGILAVVAYNPLAAQLKAQSERMQAEIFDVKKGLGAKTDGGSWLRQDSIDGPSIVHAKATADRGLTLAGLTVLQFDRNKRFYEQVLANKAELRHGYWHLRDAYVQRMGEVVTHHDSYLVTTYLSPAQVQASIGSIESLSFWELPGFIAFAERAGLPTDKYVLQYHLLLARPALFVAMVLIAATSSLKAFRFGKIQTMVLTGLSGGFLFFIFSEVSRKVGVSGHVPIAVAAWGPILIAALVSATFLLHQEDG